EATKSGWSLTSILCDDPTSLNASSGDIATRAATYKLDPGETVTCIFTNTKLTPTISSFNPTHGNGGTSVVLTGTNFTGATSVKFNGTTATFHVDSPTQITAVAPSTVSTGPITVTGPGGTGTSATNFSVP